jgi:hypothetical protein
LWTAAAESGEPSVAIIGAVSTFLGVVVTTVGVVAAQWLKSRYERTEPSPPGLADAAITVQLAKDIGQLDERANDNDERDDIQDHELRDQRNVLDEHHSRISAVERYMTDHFPDWRR